MGPHVLPQNEGRTLNGRSEQLYRDPGRGCFSFTSSRVGAWAWPSF